MGKNSKQNQMHLRKESEIALKDKRIKLFWPVAVKRVRNLDISLPEEVSYLVSVIKIEQNNSNVENCSLVGA